MPLLQHALPAFCLLLLVSIVGFWESYFSKIGSAHLTHHAHALAMLAWVLLLITQAWLIRTRRNGHHRALGRWSLLLAPLVVGTGLWVNFHFMGRTRDPDRLSAALLSLNWFGWFLPLAFALLYGLAIAHRRRADLHARYMSATALVFLIPGAARAAENYLTPVIGWAPSFLHWMFVPLVIVLWLWWQDRQAGKPTRPWALVSALWAFNLGAWVVLPHVGWWRTFSAWTANVAR
jgi:hypothetical protein